jgi:hypothetical protein
MLIFRSPIISEIVWCSSELKLIINAKIASVGLMVAILIKSYAI